jgi:hypothetical protein
LCYICIIKFKFAREGIIEIIPIWIYSSEVSGKYHDFETLTAHLQ